MDHLDDDFYGAAVQRVVSAGHCQVYRMHNETGEGRITRYAVFPGIDLSYNDFHMADGFNENKRPRENVLEINHCKEGRFECELKNGDCTYLGAGDLSVTMLSTQSVATSFPLAHFHGISITIDISVAVETMQRLSQALGGVSIDIEKIRKNLCSAQPCIVLRGLPSVEHIFSELYTVPREYRQGYFRIKILELLMFLSSVKASDFQEERSYFYHSQVKAVKEIRRYMVEHIKEHPTLEELSARFGIPLTSMKNCFKGVYGASVYAYMKDYRIQTAAFLLRDTPDSVTEIANQVGYENPSKFAGVFRKKMGVTPSAYRKSLSI